MKIHCTREEEEIREGAGQPSQCRPMSAIIINESPCSARARRAVQCHAMCTKNRRGNVGAEE